MSIKVRTSDFRTLTRSRTLPTPTDVGREIFLVARELLAGVDLGGLPVRLVGVRAEGLSPAGTTPRQPTLEEAVGENSAARRDAERVMDLVRDKFGRAALLPGSITGPGDTVTRRSTTADASGDLS